jgi:2-polyprenyl-3-methyl-5-hydroxy-6-metoxy-1,4-benzoquinol methylase
MKTHTGPGMSHIAEIRPCPVCQNRLFRKRFVKKGRNFWRCTRCGLEMQHPLPSPEELEQYYDESYSSGLYKTFTEARDMKVATAQQRLKEIEQFTTPGHWLDVGCSNGIFVEIAQGDEIRAEGIDISKVAVDEARQRGLDVFHSSIEDFNPGYTYDLVTAFDVLEHVLDPLEFLLLVHRLLSPLGKIVLSVPNQNSLICKIMGKNWYFYIPEEHLHYFNPFTIKQLLLRTGFTKVEACKRTHKPLNFEYSLTQFKEYNPNIYYLLNACSNLIPQKLRKKVIPIYIGEMIVIAQR